MEWVRARDPAGRVLALPNQTPGLGERLGLTRARLDREVWAIDRRGRSFAGAGAVNRVLAELGDGWALISRLYGVPGLTWCEDRFYAWFARHRGRFARWGVTPACVRPDVVCEPEGNDSLKG